MEDKAPRSWRHSQEDDDIHRPDAAEHVFDAAGLRNPLTSRFTQQGECSAGREPYSHAAEVAPDEVRELSGQNVPEVEMNATN